MTTAPDLEITLARNASGKPLSEDAVRRLRAVLANPTPATWDAAHSIVLCPHGAGTTLWRAVCAVRPNFPTTGPVSVWDPKYRKTMRETGWETIPDRDALVAAIRFATH